MTYLADLAACDDRHVGDRQSAAFERSSARVTARAAQGERRRRIVVDVKRTGAVDVAAKYNRPLGKAERRVIGNVARQRAAVVPSPSCNVPSPISVVPVYSSSPMRMSVPAPVLAKPPPLGLLSTIGQAMVADPSSTSIAVPSARAKAYRTPSTRRPNSRLREGDRVYRNRTVRVVAVVDRYRRRRIAAFAEDHIRAIDPCHERPRRAAQVPIGVRRIRIPNRRAFLDAAGPNTNAYRWPRCFPTGNLARREREESARYRSAKRPESILRSRREHRLQHNPK